MFTPANQVSNTKFTCLNPKRAGALLAIGVFLCVNITLSLYALTPRAKQPQERSATFQACDSAVEQFLNSSQTPQVVLMGSSLVMAPLWSLDASTFTGVVDVYHHHRALFLQQSLERAGKPTNTFSFALPGAMMSDFYLIAKKLFTNTHIPQLLICGLAPRDFMDDLLTGETRTATFQRLMTLQDLPFLGNFYLTTFQEKTDFLLNHLFYVYGKRWRYQDKIVHTLHSIYNHLFPSKTTDSVAQRSQLEQQFMLNQNHKQVWLKSIDEYRARYQHFNHEQFKKQVSFLQRLLALCHERKITIVLVNMPLTRANIELMPKELYRQYLESLNSLALKYKCTLLNLQNDSYLPNDFYDTVHLSASGGRRFVDTLASFIAKYPQKQLALR